MWILVINASLKRTLLVVNRNCQLNNSHVLSNNQSSKDQHATASHTDNNSQSRIDHATT